jgi:hypothetical protein
MWFIDDLLRRPEKYSRGDGNEQTVRTGEMSKLFEPGEINGMKLKNRFVRSATWEGMAADDGSCTP